MRLSQKKMISDIDARAAALDPRRSFIVQAPAGSGKTGLLVYRILTLLATVDQPQKVLAITFTRKAMIEMRERLLALLQCAEQGKEGGDPFEQQGIALAQDVLAQDKKFGWNLLDSPHQLQLLTIDAFSAKLASSMPWLSRLGDRARTTDQADAHYAAAVENLLSELLDDSSPVIESLKAVLLELDFNYGRARSLFTSMLAKRDQWLRHLLHNELSKLRGHIEQAWQSIINEQVAQLYDAIDIEELQELLDLGVAASQMVMVNEGKVSPLEGFKNFSRSVRFLGLAQWRAMRNMLLTSDGGWRKQVNKTIGFLPKTDAKDTLLAKLEAFRTDSQSNENLRLALLEIDYLPRTGFSDDDWKQLLALEQVLKSLAVLLQLRFRAVGECDYSEVTQRANLALQELGNPTDLGLRMDAQLQHILVDEFQDTSHGQVELLRRLTAGWSKQGNEHSNTLFLVGDPMQSIYRFREADVSLFLRVATNDVSQVFDNIEIEPLTLTENFRSSSSLVNWFNNTFEASFPIRNDVISGSVRYANATSNSPARMPCVDTFLAQDKVQEATLLVESVTRAISDLPTKDSSRHKVAILVRTRSQLTNLLPALQRAGIDYEGVDIQPLKDVQAVTDVLALCKAICREDDRVAWLALLRGPWCGLTLDEIKYCAGDPEQTVWQQLNNISMDGVASASRKRLHRFLESMGHAIQQRQQVELGSLTRWVWQSLGGEHTLFGANFSDIETVFKLISDQQRGGDLASMSDLDSALDGLYAQPRQSRLGKQPALVISTIHKAKGLQYHTVILPGLGSQARADNKEVMMWAEHQSAAGRSQLLLAPFRLEDENNSASHYHYLRQLDRRRNANETMRLMYVACTRAEQKLVLIACAKMDEAKQQIKPPVSSSLLATIWEAKRESFTFPKGLPDDQPSDTEGSEGVAYNQVLFRLPEKYVRYSAGPVQWKRPQQHNIQVETPSEASDKIEYEWATEVATGVGIVLHNWLQFNGSSALDTSVNEVLLKQWRAELIALRVPDNRLDHALKRLAKAVKNIQMDTKAHFLFRDYNEQQNEYTISSFEGGVVNTYRIDRTFIDEQGVRWIVDYKSTDTRNEDIDDFIDNQVEQRHRQQLEKYGALIRQIDARPIRLAVYFPLLKQLRAWDYQA